jgi:hypothetical protein
MVSVLLENHRNIYFRHDVDISVDKALDMAEREIRMNLKPTTYFILTSSQFYNPFSRQNKRKIEQILEMGHLIGLHYDLTLVPDNPQAQARYILWHRSILESEFDIEVQTCSIHKPSTNGMCSREVASALQVSGLHEVNITMPNYKYISDSGMNWREDYNEVIKHYDKIHVNTHPEWYADKEGTFEERLHDLKLDLKTDTLINNEIYTINDYRDKLRRNSNIT